MEYTIESQKDKSSKVMNINIKGSLNLTKSNEIKNKLLPIIQKENDIKIIIDEATDIDLSFLQILYSILKIENKKIVIAADWNQETQILIEHAGFFDLLIVKK